MQNFANLPEIEEHAALSFAATAHIYDDLWVFFLTCFYAVPTMFSSQSTHYPHNKRDVRVYIYIHVYCMYMYIMRVYIYCVSVLARFGPHEDSTLHFGPRPKKFAGPWHRPNIVNNHHHLSLSQAYLLYTVYINVETSTDLGGHPRFA